MFYFESADQALAWSTEVLRTKRFAKISPFYREIFNEGGTASLAKTHNAQALLPDDPDDRYGLAMKVDGLSQKLPEHERQILKFYYWGDYASDVLMKKAQRDVQAMRAKGIRTRMHYTYSFRHLGRMFNMDHKTAAKRVREAQESLQILLLEHGLVLEPNSRSAMQSAAMPV